MLKLWLVVAPVLSVAVTVTLYTPLVPPCEAELAKVPLMTPAALMLRPAGKPLAP